MKALILNSGQGSRMGELTSELPKCMVEIVPGHSVIDLQMQNLISCGVKEAIITTGPFAEKLENHLKVYEEDILITYVKNPIFDKTNYIYSIALAQEELKNDDIILMHGDLIFTVELLQRVIESTVSVMVVDSTLPLPEKDFKAVIKNGRINKIGVEFFELALQAQPLYKWCHRDMELWLNEILEFCRMGIQGVYAENAFNEISQNIKLIPLEAEGQLCMEVDTMEDLARARLLYKEN